MFGQTAVSLKTGITPSTTPSSMWGTLNANAARTLAPMARNIDDALKAAGAPADLRSKIVSRPLDAILDIFDPIEDAIGRAVDRVIARKGATQTFFGQRRVITRVQSVDRTKDRSTQNLLRSLRTIDAFMVLFWTQPVELAQEMLKEGFDIASEAAKVVATTAAKTGDAAAKAVASAWSSVSNFLNLSGWIDDDDGLGQGGPAEGLGVGAALGLTGTAAAALDGVLVVVIGAIVTYAGNFVAEQIMGGANEDDVTTMAPLSPFASRLPVLSPTRIPVVTTSTAPPTVGPSTTQPGPTPFNPPPASSTPSWLLPAVGVAAVVAFLALRK